MWLRRINSLVPVGLLKKSSDITMMKHHCFYILPWHFCCCFGAPFVLLFSFAIELWAKSSVSENKGWSERHASRRSEWNALPVCLVCEHNISLYWEIYVPEQCLLYNNKWWAWLHLQRIREIERGGDGVRVRKRDSERKLWAVKKRGSAEEKRKQMHLII